MPLRSRPFSRRELLGRAGCGFGALALTDLLARQGLLAAAPEKSLPETSEMTRTSHFEGKAKSVIFLFMYGGPSQVDLFDYKPALQKYREASNL